MKTVVYTDDFLKNKKKVKKLNDIISLYKKTLEKINDTKGDGFSKVLDDLRYCILKVHLLTEISVDIVISKRYSANRHLADALRTDILAQVDFYRKIRILEAINRDCGLDIDMEVPKAINRIRNAVAHNYSLIHKDYCYGNGHIVYDLKIASLFDDFMELFVKLSKIDVPITPNCKARSDFLKWIRNRGVLGTGQKAS